MNEYKIEKELIEDSNKKVIVFRVLANPSNVQPNITGIKGTNYQANIGQDKDAIHKLETEIENYTGNRQYERFDKVGDSYSVIIIERKSQLSP